MTPLKQFTEAVLAPEGTPNRDQNFSDKAANLQQFSNRAVKTAKMVAAGILKFLYKIDFKESEIV